MGEIIQGDCLTELAKLPANSVDAVLTDPPYGLGEIRDFPGLLQDWINGGDGLRFVGSETLEVRSFHLFLGYNDRAGQCYQHPRHDIPNVSRNAMNILSSNLPGVGSCVKECEHCSAQFKVKPSHASKRKTCSKACMYELMRGQKIERACDFCGKTMFVQPSRGKHKRGLVCSRACQYAKNKQTFKSKDAVISQCLCCGNSIRTPPSKLKQRRGVGKYCSRECRDEHRKGEHHPMYINGRASEKRGKNWQAQKRNAKKRDNFTCQYCGLPEQQSIDQTGQPLHVHHIIPYRLFDHYKPANQLTNLVTLCAACHRSADARWVRDEQRKGFSSPASSPVQPKQLNIFTYGGVE